MQSFTCTVFKGEQESWGAESAIAPRLAAARMAWLAEILYLSAYVLQVVSARWRSTEMCPCDVACMTVRLVEILLA